MASQIGPRPFDRACARSSDRWIPRALRALLATLLISILLLPQALAQTGTLRGWVRDAAGMAIGGAQFEVRARDSSLRFATSSGSDGSYQLLQLPSGTFDVTLVDEADRNLCPKGLEPLIVRQYELKELVIEVAADGSCSYKTFDGQPAPGGEGKIAETPADVASSAGKKKILLITLGSLAGLAAAVALLDSDDDDPATPVSP